MDTILSKLQSLLESLIDYIIGILIKDQRLRELIANEVNKLADANLEDAISDAIEAACCDGGSIYRCVDNQLDDYDPTDHRDFDDAVESKVDDAVEYKVEELLDEKLRSFVDRLRITIN